MTFIFHRFRFHNFIILCFNIHPTEPQIPFFRTISIPNYNIFLKHRTAKMKILNVPFDYYYRFDTSQYRLL